MAVKKPKGVGALIATVGLTLAALLVVVLAGWVPKRGLDLSGGVSLVLQPVREGKKLTKVPADALEQTRRVIQTRADALGVAEPEITIQGTNIVVELPGIKDQKRVLDIVGKTAELRFRPVLDTPSSGAPTNAASQIKDLKQELKIPADVTAQQVYEAEQTARRRPPRSRPRRSCRPPTPRLIPPRPRRPPRRRSHRSTSGELTSPTPTFSSSASSNRPSPTPRRVTPPAKDIAKDPVTLMGTRDENGVAYKYKLGPTLLRGTALETAAAGVNSQNGQWVVNPTFKSGKNGIDLFNKAAALCNAGDAKCPPRARARAGRGSERSRSSWTAR
ncbi:MAG: hypothetical protein R2698_13595 [Microthrixaceae bacterium]